MHTASGSYPLPGASCPRRQPPACPCDGAGTLPAFPRVPHVPEPVGGGEGKRRPLLQGTGAGHSHLLPPPTPAPGVGRGPTVPSQGACLMCTEVNQGQPWPPGLPLGLLRACVTPAGGGGGCGLLPGGLASTARARGPCPPAHSAAGSRRGQDPGGWGVVSWGTGLLFPANSPYPSEAKADSGALKVGLCGVGSQGPQKTPEPRTLL